MLLTKFNADRWYVAFEVVHIEYILVQVGQLSNVRHQMRTGTFRDVSDIITQWSVLFRNNAPAYTHYPSTHSNWSLTIHQFNAPHPRVQPTVGLALFHRPKSDLHVNVVAVPSCVRHRHFSGK